jgi:hypothetical protein
MMKFFPYTSASSIESDRLSEDDLTVTIPKQFEQANDLAKNSCCNVVYVPRNVDVPLKQLLVESISERKPRRVRSNDM